MYILCSTKFSPEENFCLLTLLLSWVKFLSSVNVAWEKFYSVIYFCNSRIGGLGNIFVQRKISAIKYIFNTYRAMRLAVVIIWRRSSSCA